MASNHQNSFRDIGVIITWPSTENIPRRFTAATPALASTDDHAPHSSLSSFASVGLIKLEAIEDPRQFWSQRFSPPAPL